MPKCASSYCAVPVIYEGDLCGMCGEQIVDDFDPEDDEDDDDEQWECAYPGECLMPGMGHHRCECYTIEDAEEMDGGV